MLYSHMEGRGGNKKIAFVLSFPYKGLYGWGVCQSHHRPFHTSWASPKRQYNDNIIWHFVVSLRCYDIVNISCKLHHKIIWFDLTFIFMWSNDCGLLSGYDDDERIRNDLRIDQTHTHKNFLGPIKLMDIV